MNKGKEFEHRFYNNWISNMPGSFILRLYDTTNGYLGIQNPCDYVCFTNKKLFMVECKSHEGASIPFSVIPQYDRLLQYKDLENVYPGILIWFIDKDKIIWVPIKTAEKIYNSGSKSIRIKHIDDPEYDIKVIPTQKKRIFLEADLTVFKEF